MPSQREHRAAAARHLRAYRTLIERHPDWAAVALFYAALHRMEEAFAAVGVHNTTHSNREYFIKTSPLHMGIWPAYHRLENESMKARYLQGGPFALNSKSVRNELCRLKYAEVCQHVRRVLGLRVRTRPIAPAKTKAAP